MKAYRLSLLNFWIYAYLLVSTLAFLFVCLSWDDYKLQLGLSGGTLFLVLFFYVVPVLSSVTAYLFSQDAKSRTINLNNQATFLKVEILLSTSTFFFTLGLTTVILLFNHSHRVLGWVVSITLILANLWLAHTWEKEKEMLV